MEEAVIGMIRENRIAARDAILKVTEQLMQVFTNMKDEYMRARRDIQMWATGGAGVGWGRRGGTNGRRRMDRYTEDLSPSETWDWMRNGYVAL